MSRVIVRSKEMPIYENCFKRGFRFYVVSPLNSTWYIECVRLNRFGYDVLGPIAVQLEALFSIYVRLEVELKDVFKK